MSAKLKVQNHPLYCPWCHINVGAVTLESGSNRIYYCQACQRHFAGPAWPGKCLNCQALPKHIAFRKIAEEGESLPGDLCPGCQVKADAQEETLKAGGVIFSCKSCGSQGILAGTTDIAQKIREDLKKPAPEPASVFLQQCPKCDQNRVSEAGEVESPVEEVPHDHD